jgi:hypothetical protein
LVKKPKQTIIRFKEEASAPAPYALNAAQEESGEMPSVILHRDLRFKDGLVEIAGYVSQIQTIHKEQKRQ